MNTAEKNGMERFGYIPGGENCPQTTRLSNIFDASKKAIKTNRENVNAAKQRGYAGDWKMTNRILRGISTFTGLYFTR
jgi:hypothetical protein